MQRELQQLILPARHARGRAALVLAAALAPLCACTDYVEPAWETGTVPVSGGGELYYEVVGSGEPLLLLHDFSLDRRMWEDQMLAFSARYRVIRYDARGFGRSGSEIGAEYSPSDDLRALLEFLGVRSNVRVVGASMGARYAIEFVLNNSDRVRAMVLSDPLIHLGRTQQAFTEALNPAKLAAQQTDDMNAARSAWFDSAIFVPARRKAALERRLKRMLDDYSGWHFEFGPSQFEAVISPPVYLQLGQVAVPTLLLVGELDIADVVESASALDQGLVDADTPQIIPDAGHFPNMERPDDFNQIVLQFFDQAE